MAGAVGPAPETTPQVVSPERSPIRKTDLLRQLDYTEIDDSASNNQFAELWRAEFPWVLGKRTRNPLETNLAERSNIQPPKCTTLQTREGERLWELALNKHMSIIVGSQKEKKPDIDEEGEGYVLPIKNIFLQSRKGGKIIDLMAVFRSYELRRKQVPADVYLAISHMSPYYFPGDEGEKPYIVAPVALKREGPRTVIDVDNTVNQFIHEGGHAVRRQADERLLGAAESEHTANTTTEKRIERGAHAAGLLLVHRLREYVDIGSYRRFMKGSLKSYQATENPNRNVSSGK